MELTEFISNQYLVEHQKDTFVQELAFGVIPLFKKKAQLSEEKVLLRQQKKRLHAVKLSTDVVPVGYETAQKMNECFREYVKTVDCVQKGDLHGASIRIVRSACPEFVGREGIITQEMPQKIVVVGAQGSFQVEKRLVDFLVEGRWYIVGKIRNQRYKQPKRWTLDF